MNNTPSITPDGTLVDKIYFIRGQKVMIDRDLAELYGVETKNLNLSVKGNVDRFPEDFMFRLTKTEYESLRLQTETLKRGSCPLILVFARTNGQMNLRSNKRANEFSLEQTGK